MNVGDGPSSKVNETWAPWPRGTSTFFPRNVPTQGASRGALDAAGLLVGEGWVDGLRVTVGSADGPRVVGDVRVEETDVGGPKGPVCGSAGVAAPQLGRSTATAIATTTPSRVRPRRTS